MLDDKVAIVLGASARGGTGWVTAETLAAAGAKVVVGARSIEPLRQLADEIGGTAVQCDMASPEDIAHLVDVAMETHGKIDVAVSAAAQVARGLILDIDPATVQRSFDVNFMGQFHFVRNVAARMTRGGAITLISSAGAAQPVADRFAYGCAKAATDTLARHAAVEFGPRGIRVNSILPGPIRTPLLQDVLEKPGVEAAFVREIPIGRIAEPKDVAETILWLSVSSYLTGLNLPVSGGMHLMRPPRAEDLS